MITYPVKAVNENDEDYDAMIVDGTGRALEVSEIVDAINMGRHQSLPDKRYARITVRNPNKRPVAVEICGERAVLDAGESTDLCLTDDPT